MRDSGIFTSSLKTLSSRLMLVLVVFAMIYRGAIPVGYMLSPASSTSGQLMITLCVAGGAMVSMPVDLAGQQEAPASNDASALECPFAIVAAQFLLSEVVTTVALGSPVDRPAAFIAYKSAPALPALGPPLGSRAPPLNLA